MDQGRFIRVALLVFVGLVLFSILHQNTASSKSGPLAGVLGGITNTIQSAFRGLAIPVKGSGGAGPGAVGAPTAQAPQTNTAQTESNAADVQYQAAAAHAFGDAGDGYVGAAMGAASLLTMVG